MKKFLIFIGSLLIFITCVNAESCKNIVNVNVFHGDGCPHCSAAFEFLHKLAVSDECIKISKYEVWYNAENALLMKSVASYLDEEVSGVPYIVIGNTTYKGYADSYDEDIKNTIAEYYNSNNYEDVVTKIKDGDINVIDKKTNNDQNSNENSVQDNYENDIIIETSEYNDSDFSFDYKEVASYVAFGFSIISLLISIISLKKANKNNQ